MFKCCLGMGNGTWGAYYLIRLVVEETENKERERGAVVILFDGDIFIY